MKPTQDSIHTIPVSPEQHARWKRGELAPLLAKRHPTRVTWAAGRVGRASGGALARWRKRLERAKVD